MTAIADPLLERARSWPGGPGAKRTTASRRCWTSRSTPCTSACPRSRTAHPEAAAIERGLPFFVEKPLAVDPDTAENRPPAWPRATW